MDAYAEQSKLLMIAELKAPKLFSGQAGEVNARVFYGGLKPLQATVVLEVPAEFKVEPAQTTVVLAPNAFTPVSFKVTPSEESNGSYNALLTIASSEASVVRGVLLVVDAPRGFAADSFLVFAALAAIVLAAVVLQFSSYSTHKQLKRLRFLREEEAGEREGFLEQVKRGISD